MGKVTLSDIVKMPAFEDAGNLFYRATGMTLSFYNESDEVVFYPSEERCDLCHLIQSTALGWERCQKSDRLASERALRAGEPIAYTCHAGLTDVVVPVVVAGDRIGCFYSGQSLLTPPTAMGYSEIRNRIADLGLDPDALWDAYNRIPVVNSDRLQLAMGLLSTICGHLVEGEIAIRQERELTREQRKLRRAAEEKAHLERDLREMELKLMQAQLNPHYLFNALNLILGQSMAEEASKTAGLVQDLSTLLRNSLTTVTSMVTLAEEIASAQAYVSIFKQRFGHNIELTTELPDALRQFRVPSLILQPIVENSLIHAFPGSREGFRIEISAASVPDGVRLRVCDNGPGMEQPQLKRIAKMLSEAGHEAKLTGLFGVNRRLKYYYPDMSDIRLMNTGGLVVVMDIPAA